MANLETLLSDVKKTKAAIARQQTKLDALKTEVNEKLDKFDLSFRDL